MIEQSFNSIISQNALLIEQSKTQIRTAADVELRKRVEQELSDPENIQAAFKAVPVNRAEDLREVEKVRDKLVFTHDNLANTVSSKNNEVKAIKTKINSIKDNLSKLKNPDPEKKGIIDIGNEYLPILVGIIAGLNAGLGLLTGLLGNGQLEKRIGDAIDETNGKVRKFNSIVTSFTDIEDNFNKKISSLANVVDPAIDTLSELETRIQTSKNLIELNYLNTIAPYLDLLTDGGSLPNNEEGINLDTLPSNYEDLIDQLPTTNKNKMFQYFETIGKPLKTGYRITKS